MNHSKTICFIVSLVILTSTPIGLTGHISPNISKKVDWGVRIFSFFNSTIQQYLLDLGVNWIRIGSRITSASNNSRRLDSLVSWAVKHDVGMECLLSLPRGNFTLSQWEAYVTYNVNKYKNDIFVWEIWNEPLGFKWGYQDGTPEHYFDMLKSAYVIIKSIQPSATVIGLGGSIIHGSSTSTSNAQKEFSKQVYDLGGGSYCDAISLHFYPGTVTSNSIFKQYQIYLNNYIAVWGKPIWVTETGQRSSSLSYTEEDQADYLVKADSFFAQDPIVTVFWFQLLDGDGVPSKDYSFGLVGAGMIPKLSYNSLKTICSDNSLVNSTRI